MKFMISIEAESAEEARSRIHNGAGTISIVKQFEGHIGIVKPEPWPTILIPLKALAKSGDRGAGDIIARVIGPIGGDAFKRWYKRLFGRDCGCGHRQEVLNARWPLQN